MDHNEQALRDEAMMGPGHPPAAWAVAEIEHVRAQRDKLKTALDELRLRAVQHDQTTSATIRRLLDNFDVAKDYMESQAQLLALYQSALVYAQNAVAHTGHDPICKILLMAGHCTCGSVDEFKVARAEFYRAVAAIDTAVNPSKPVEGEGHVN